MLRAKQVKTGKSCTSIAKTVQNKQEKLLMNELQKIRIRLKAYDHALWISQQRLLVLKTGATVSGLFH